MELTTSPVTLPSMEPRFTLLPLVADAIYNIKAYFRYRFKVRHPPPICHSRTRSHVAKLGKTAKSTIVSLPLSGVQERNMGRGATMTCDSLVSTSYPMVDLDRHVGTMGD